MYYFAVFSGILIAAYLVVSFRKTGLERKNWVYPAFLATFPLYYWVFAVSASDYHALVNEMAVGAGFLLVAFVAFKLKSFPGLLLLALAYIAHAIYDVIHNALFYNAGTPLWWPEFCGAVDVLIGLYLVYFAFSMKRVRVQDPR